MLFEVFLDSENFKRMFESMNGIDRRLNGGSFSCLGQPKIYIWIDRLLCRSFQFHKL